jgi:hypothetical protein
MSSSEKRSKQPVVRWTADEDASLIKLVHEHGTSEWVLIASKLAGGRRNNNQCLIRWKFIDPSVTPGKFSSAEDASLTKLVHEHGTSAWTLVATKLEGGKRNDRQCRNRWRTIDPSMSTGKFSAAEDASLTNLVHEHGTSAWTLVATKLEGGKRNDRQCLGRWRYLGKSNGKGSSSSSSSSSSTKQSAPPNPPSKCKADSDGNDDDDDSSANDDASFDHVLIDGFSQALAAAAPHQSRKRKSTDS